MGAKVQEGAARRELLGDLKLTNEELEALVAFMNTLTDGYQLD